MLLQIIGLVFGALIIVFVARSFYVSQPLFKEKISQAPDSAFTLAPIEQALSFARTKKGKSLLVVSMNREGLRAIDLAAATKVQGREPLDFLRALGDEKLRAVTSGDATIYTWRDLGVPFDTQGGTIAAGVNFKAHAEETGLEDGPFLFPKLSTPSAWKTPVQKRTRLDYEVELCAVAIEDIAPGRSGRFGFVLCNDLTDRWALLRHINLKKPMGRTGFPEGKGGEGMLPVGAILVVPSKPDFYQQIELGLTVNHRLRQRDSAGLMIWDAPSIGQKALDLCDKDFYLYDALIRLTECERLKKGTAILLGTPEGVAFQMPNIWMPWAYLRRGDAVTAFGTHLGVLETRVE